MIWSSAVNTMKQRLFWTLCTALLGVFLVPTFAQAAEPEVTGRDNGYAARYVSQTVPDPIEIEAGTTKEVTITFKNVGTKTWNASGSRYISAYTMDPRYRESDFAGSGWKSKKQTAAIGGSAAPGKTTTLTISLTAPEKTGEYTEKFYLAAENYSWVEDGYFFLKMNVVPKKVVAAPAPVASAEEVVTEPEEETPTFEGKNIGQNISNVSVPGGHEIRLIALFQNTGDVEWSDYALTANTPTTLAGDSLTFADTRWANATTAIKKTNPISAGAVAREEFYFRAPTKKGTYKAQFSLQVAGSPIDGAMSEVTVHVTENAPLNYTPPSFGSSAPALSESVRLSAEPRIRVGMQLPMDFVQFRSESHDYRVMVNDEEIGILPATNLGVFKHDGMNYSFKGADVDYLGPDHVRLEPDGDARAIFALSNYDRHVRWKGPNNFNTYRGAFEYRQGKVDKLMYAVNDLLMGDYVAGIAETSNRAPVEYIKALLVAARTYAYKSMDKYPFFDVLGNTYDQLYLGYESERLMPNVAQAARDTRGYMVTYEGEIVTTPYFANSTGMTKSWAAVWGGRTPRPWLVPVVAEYDRGQPIRGHGVGMSARDAAIRADKEGASWEELIKHYYTGVEVEKIFN